MRRTCLLATLLLSSGCQLQTSGLTSRPLAGGSVRVAAPGTATSSSPDRDEGDDGGAAARTATVFRRAPGVRSVVPGYYIINMAPTEEPGDSGSYCPTAGGVMDLDAIPTWPVPDLLDQDVDQVLATLLPLGQYCLYVIPDPDCTAPSGAGRVCHQSPSAGEEYLASWPLHVHVQSDVRYEGQPSEQRRVPDVANRPIQEARAALERAGFRDVKVVEDGALCERGVVCDMTPAGGFYPPGGEVVLHVRPPARPR